MVYYLGKDVRVYITTETSEAGVNAGSVGLNVQTGSDATTYFGHKLHADSLTTSGNEIADLTGVDIGISAQDEDISYVGRMNILKSEIKKETTVSLTRKKAGPEWDLIYCGPVYDTQEYDNGTLDHGARWGIAYRASGGGAGASNLISNGLISPIAHDHPLITAVTFGYRIHVQLKSGGQWLAIPGCQITGHTVSINGDGTSEETMEFSSNVDMKVKDGSGDVSVMLVADM